MRIIMLGVLVLSKPRVAMMSNLEWRLSCWTLSGPARAVAVARSAVSLETGSPMPPQNHATTTTYDTSVVLPFL